MCVFVCVCVCVCVCERKRESVCVCVSHIPSFQTGSGLKLTRGLPCSTRVTLIAKVTVQLVSGFYNPLCVWIVCRSVLLFNIFWASLETDVSVGIVFFWLYVRLSSSGPFWWMRYLRNTVRELLHSRHKRSLRLGVISECGGQRSVWLFTCSINMHFEWSDHKWTAFGPCSKLRLDMHLEWPLLYANMHITGTNGYVFFTQRKKYLKV